MAPVGLQVILATKIARQARSATLDLEIAAGLDKATSFFQIHGSLDSSEVDLLIKLRNDIVHGSAPSEKSAQKILADWEPKLHKVVSSLWQRLRFKMTVPLSLNFNGSTFAVEVRIVSGSSTIVPKTLLQTETLVICNRTYLYTSGDKPQWTPIFPFIVTEPSTEPDSWKVLLYDNVKIRMKANAPTVRNRSVTMTYGRVSVIFCPAPK